MLGALFVEEMNMKVVATTPEQMLETVLFHLHARGYVRVDFDKLVEAYNDFRTYARRCVYKIASGPDYGLKLRAFIELDIQSLERQGRAMRTIGRVWLTPLGVKEAFWLKLEQATFGTLLKRADITFPPLAAARP